MTVTGEVVPVGALEEGVSVGPLEEGVSVEVLEVEFDVIAEGSFEGYDQLGCTVDIDSDV